MRDEMKKLFLYVFVFFGLVQSCFADINKEKAVAMIENLTKEGIEEIVNSNKSVEEKNEVLKEFLQREYRLRSEVWETLKEQNTENALARKKALQEEFEHIRKTMEWLKGCELK